MAAKRSDPTWSMDREIVITRVFDAPRELVFRAWTDAEHFGKWFGPSGFSIVMKEPNIREGGLCRFDMLGPDGTVYDNRMLFLEVKPYERLVFDHGHDKDEDPGTFRVTITFEEQSNKKTVVTLRQLHPTKEQRDGGVGFGAVELGYQTMDKLAAHLARLK